MDGSEEERLYMGAYLERAFSNGSFVKRREERRLLLGVMSLGVWKQFGLLVVDKYRPAHI